MAIYKTANGWLVDAQPGGRTGRRVRRTFIKKDFATQFERQIMLDAERRLIGVAGDMTLTALIDEFTAQYAKLRFRGFNVEKYRLKQLREYFAKHDKTLSDLRLSDGELFIAHRKEEGRAVGTINRDLNTLKRIMTWAVEREYLPFSPFEKRLKKLKGETVRVRWLTEEERSKLLCAALQMGQEFEEFVFVGLETGFRLSNLLRLQAINFGKDFVTAERTKSGKPYDVPITEALRARLPVLLTRQGNLLTPGNVQKRFRRVVKQAGLDASDPAKIVTIHTLRHTFASYWLQRGVPIYTVSKWLGHSSVQVTEQVYGHLSKDSHLTEMRAAERRHLVDTQIIAFPEKPSVSNGPYGIRTRDLCLESDKTRLEDVISAEDKESKAIER